MAKVTFKSKKSLKLILLISILVLPLIAGYLLSFKYYILSAIFILLAIILSFVREKFQAYIEGDGVGKITASETEPKNPTKGDLWINMK